MGQMRAALRTSVPGLDVLGSARASQACFSLGWGGDVMLIGKLFSRWLSIHLDPQLPAGTVAESKAKFHTSLAATHLLSAGGFSSELTKVPLSTLRKTTSSRFGIRGGDDSRPSALHLEVQRALEVVVHDAISQKSNLFEMEVTAGPYTLDIVLQSKLVSLVAM